jgi:Fe-S-cluster containining protein
LNYSCLCCGTCCQKYQPWLTPEEITEIASQLEITPQQFISDYTDHRWPGTESFLLIHVNQACVFMRIAAETNLSLCRIHSFKPASCRAWAAGIYKSECQSGLKQLFGISVDSTGGLLATDEQQKSLSERIKLINQLSKS